MITEADSETLAVEIAALNAIPLALARDYAGRIGDTPELAEDGRAIVRDGTGRELARVHLAEQAASGAPPIPASVSAEQLPFVSLRVIEGEAGIEPDVECYDTRTGTSIPGDA